MVAAAVTATPVIADALSLTACLAKTSSLRREQGDSLLITAHRSDEYNRSALVE